MAQHERTEKPTQQRLQKARREGRFPFSREFLAAAQIAAVVVALDAWGTSAVEGGRRYLARVLRAAVHQDVTPASIVLWYAEVVRDAFLPFLLAGSALAAVTALLHLSSTGFGFAPGKLAPKFERLNPATQLRQVLQNNTKQAIEAAFLLPLACLALWAALSRDLVTLARLPLAPVPSATGAAGELIGSLLWKGAAVFVAFGLFDLFRARRKHQNELNMTRQEVRQEAKENEGNPQIKARVRRIQSDLVRKRMMQDIAKAAVVVVNPTHYAAAVRYDPKEMAAPVVVAKGKNFLALRIKDRARQYGVPIVENKQLAQALYKSVDVGQEIPPNLYRAVAEILAYIFRLQNRRAG